MGKLYAFLGQRTVGSGGCTASKPRARYGNLFGVQYEPLPKDTPPRTEKLRAAVNGYRARAASKACAAAAAAAGSRSCGPRSRIVRGYDLITIYDD